jgi:chorismate mutase/prephenate dehydratase
MARHPRGTAGSALGTPNPAGSAGRSTDPDRPGPSPSPSPELRRIRRRIDAIDRRIVALLSERAALGLTAREAKRAAGRRAIRDPEREQAVLAQIAAANPGPLPDDDLLAIYRRIISATRRVESAARRSRHAGRQ